MFFEDEPSDLELAVYPQPNADVVVRGLATPGSIVTLPLLLSTRIGRTSRGPTVILLFTLIRLILLWLNHDRRGCAYIAAGGFGAGIGTFVMKHLFTRERPSIVLRLVEVSGFSYPSGHSLAATSLYLLLMFLAWRHYKAW